uniref:Bridging integrator 1b n=1 Tax=Gadus morhua TaxID=8049 RepID=A0A8C5CTP1_GADMO
MAEIGKGVTAGKLAINVQKKFTRAQEKVLQKLGKADETRDAAFEETVGSFNKQMVEGAKLQKDLKAYLLAVKTMHDASRRLQECLAEMYDPEWFGKEEVDSMVEEMIEKEMDNTLEDTDANWTDYYEKLTDESLLSLDTYLSQFPDIKARLAKRERKMVDFDSARHHFASIQKGKKKDEAKIAKPAALLEMAAPLWAQGLLSAHQVAQTHLSKNQAEEELGRAQKVFEELNVELQDELPVLWDSRVGVYVNTFQNLASNQEKFHRDMGKVSVCVCKRLCPPPSRPPARMSLTPSPGPEDDESPETAPTSTTSVTSTSPISTPQVRPPLPIAPELLLPPPFPPPPPPPPPPLSPPPPPSSSSSSSSSCSSSSSTSSLVFSSSSSSFSSSSYTSTLLLLLFLHSPPLPLSFSSSSSSSVVLIHPPPLPTPPPFSSSSSTSSSSTRSAFPFLKTRTSRVFVKVLHDYAATDGDELELKTGDMVLVMAFDSPDEQDDGWLVGVKESHWLQHKDISIKGVFPENFTQKV